MAQIAGNLQRIKNGQRRYAITPRIFTHAFRSEVQLLE